MQKIRYIGGSDSRTLTGDDMAAIGLEDHPGLAWTQEQPVVEVEEDVAEVLLNSYIHQHFKVEPSDQVKIEDMVEANSKDDLVDQAQLLGLTGTSKMNKEELAEAIVTKQAELQTQPPAQQAALEPHVVSEDPIVTTVPET